MTIIYVCSTAVVCIAVSPELKYSRQEWEDSGGKQTTYFMLLDKENKRKLLWHLLDTTELMHI